MEIFGKDILKNRRYSARPKLNVKRGLYYYLIENEETEEPVLTGKFEMK